MNLTATRVRAAAAATTAAAVAGYASNECEVNRRALRLQQLRACDAEYPRVRSDERETMAKLQAPIVVTGLIDRWPAREWTWGQLRARLGDELVDTGSSQGGVPWYLVSHNATMRGDGRHDLALYVFDSDFESSSGKASLLDDWFPLTALTSGDVFACDSAAAHSERPSWRWLLAGPPGSGTPLHQDPWGYSSWNASVVGSKRWVLFPPDVPRHTLFPPREDLLARLCARVGIELPRSAAAFMDELLPSLREQDLGVVEFVQAPGEVVAFPAGWWHAVVNLSPTLAVTESFGRPEHLPLILSKLRERGLGDLAAVIEAEQASLVR